MRVGGIASLLFPVALAACSSIPSVTFSDDAGATDGGPVPGCTPNGVEVCDDGVDNDCNGRIDCSDPACGGFTCIEPAPSGFSQVAFADAARTDCPTGFSFPIDLRVVAGEGTCSCNCTPSGPACSAGAVSYAQGTTDACSDGPHAVTADGTCQNLGGGQFDVPASAFTHVTPPPGPTSCAANGSQPTPLTDGRMCPPLGRIGAGCPTGLVCVPNATTSAGYKQCITATGSGACPSTFPSKRRAGTSATDTRQCSSCECGTAPCESTVEMFDSPGCNGAASLTLSGGATCAQGSNAAFKARGAKATATGGCAPTKEATLQGSLTLADERTVCCK